MTTKIKTAWRTVGLGEVADVIRGVSFGPGEGSLKSFEGGVPILRANNVKENGQLDLSDLMYVKPSKISEPQKLQRNDIVLVASSGSKKLVGKNTSIDSVKHPLSFGAFMYGVRPRSIDPSYLRLFFRSPSYKNQLQEMVDGTNIINLRRTDLAAIKLYLPEDDEMTRRIAGMLAAFDEKIENNNRIIKTLEEMAQAIFKKQFDVSVDELPKGWGVKNVLEVVKRIPVGRKYENKTALPSGKVPILDQGQSGYIGFHNDEPGVEASIDEPVVVFTNHTCNYRLMTRPFSAIQNVLPYVGINDYPTLFVYYLTRGKITMQEYKGHWPEFEQQEFVVPPPALAKEFASFVKPMVQKIVEAENENQKLAAMRDLLLPRLMSGEIRV